MVDGGVVAGSSSMVLGASGAGKTLLGLQFLAAGVIRGERGLYVGSYEAPTRLIAKAEGIGLALGAAVASGDIEVQWEPPIDLILDRTGSRILDAVRHRRIRRLVIDGLNALEIGAAFPERLTTFVTALLNELRALDVTTVVTAETRPLFATHVDVPTNGVSPMIENVFMLRHVEVRSQLHRLISVLKLRDSAHDRSLHEFRITSNGLDVASTFESAEAILTGEARHTGERDSGRTRK
jgi:circadian clock protein KaiC